MVLYMIIFNTILSLSVGWGTDQRGFEEQPGMKTQIMNLVRSIRTVMRSKLYNILNKQMPSLEVILIHVSIPNKDLLPNKKLLYSPVALCYVECCYGNIELHGYYRFLVFAHHFTRDSLEHITAQSHKQNFVNSSLFFIKGHCISGCIETS